MRNLNERADNMKKIPPHVKRRIKKRSKNVRVIGTMQPPEEMILENEIQRLEPYVTANELTEWANAFQHRQEQNKPSNVTAEDSIYLSLVLSDLQRTLFNGIYETTKANPVYAMEAFVETHKRGVYPPLWVLDWLHEAFEKYLMSAENGDLALLLKINRGRGKTTAKNEAQMLLNENSIMQQILQLNVDGMSIEKAAAQVAERLEEQQMTKPRRRSQFLCNHETGPDGRANWL